MFNNDCWCMFLVYFNCFRWANNYVFPVVFSYKMLFKIKKAATKCNKQIIKVGRRLSYLLYFNLCTFSRGVNQEKCLPNLDGLKNSKNDWIIVCQPVKLCESFFANQKFTVDKKILFFLWMPIVLNTKSWVLRNARPNVFNEMR